MVLEERIRFSRHVLTTSIRLKCLDMFTQLIFQFCLKFNEVVQDIEPLMHQVNISKPKVIINNVNVMKYSYLPRAWILKVSHMLVCTNFKHSLILYSLMVKDPLVILPSI